MSKINYPLHRIRGIVFDVDGVLSPSTVPMDENGVPRRMVNIKDGYALQHAVKTGMKIAIITGANTESIVHRYAALGIKDVYLCASKKLPVFEAWMKTSGLQPDEVAYVGDDIPDIQCMRHAGLAIAPADAAHEVLTEARYVTVAKGGYGVAREVLEQILSAHDSWMNDTEAFGW